MEKRQSEGLVTCSACTCLLHPSSQWWTELRFLLRKTLGRKSAFFTWALPRWRHSRIRKCRRLFLSWMGLCCWVPMCCATFKTTGFKSKLYNFGRSWLQALKTWRIAWTKWNSLSLWLLSFATPPWSLIFLRLVGTEASSRRNSLQARWFCCPSLRDEIPTNGLLDRQNKINDVDTLVSKLRKVELLDLQKTNPFRLIEDRPAWKWGIYPRRSHEGTGQWVQKQPSKSPISAPFSDA